MRARSGRRFDRLVAGGALFVVGGAFVIVVAVSAVPDAPAPRPDPQAAIDMLALMRAAERLDYAADYDFTRAVLGGARRTSTAHVAQLHGAHVSRADDALDITGAGGSYRCQLVDGRSGCFKTAEGQALPQSDVFEAAIGTGTYFVINAPGAEIAAERARCFETRSADGRPLLPDIGRSTILCFARDGLPLRTKIVHPNPVDEWTATRVERRIDRSALTPLLAGFERKTPATGG